MTLLLRFTVPQESTNQQLAVSRLKATLNIDDESSWGLKHTLQNGKKLDCER